jgi:cell division septation protein DedD
VKRAEKMSKKGKRYQLEFSFTSLFFWSLGLLFILGWIFVLGILVGRGFLPEGVKNLTELRSQITKLQDMVSKKKNSDLDVIKNSKKTPKFAFYEELSKKKEEPVNVPKPPKKKTDKKETATKPEPVEKIEAVPPVQKKPAQAVEDGAKYTVQIASLEREIQAIRMVNEMVARGYPAFYLKANVRGKTYFRVRCGRFVSRKEADEFLKLLAGREKIKGFVARIDH